MWMLVMIPLAILLPYLGCFILAPGSSYSDLLISHLPNAIYLRQAILQYHQIPLWSPIILSGYPFAADPLSGLWYPPGWLAVILPEPWGFNTAVLLHLFWGGLGLYLFLKKSGVSPLSAAFGGMIYAALPKTIAHLGAGHITLVYAVSWTAWLLFAEEMVVSAGKRRLVQFLPGLVLGLITLADVRWAIPAGLLWLAYAVYRRVQPQAGSLARDNSLGGCLVNCLGYLLGQTCLAILIAAPILLPLAQFASLSTRSTMSLADATTASLPPVRLAGLIFPFLGQNAEWTLYLGGVVLVLLLVSILGRDQRKKIAFWWIVILMSLVLAMGGYIPIVRDVYRLPGFSLLRVPPRFLFLTGISAAIIAADGLEFIGTKLSEPSILRKPGVVLGLAAIGFFVLLFSAGLGVLTPGKALSSIVCGLIVFSAAIVVILRIKSVLRPDTAAWVMIGLLVIDLSLVNRLAINPTPGLPEYPDAQAVIKQVSADPDLYRVYSPSYSLPQEAAAHAGIQLADGIDPLQLSTYEAFFEAASGIPDPGYSVTLPPYTTASPEVDNLEYTPDPASLGLLNLKYVVSQFDLAANGLEEIGHFGETRLYQNAFAMPRAWIQAGDRPDKSADRSVDTLSWSPDTIQVQANGPGMLVLSEIAYPGWEATIDGKPAAVETVDGILRSVRLAGGAHQIQFDFRPLIVYLGLACGVLGWGWVVLGWLISRRVGRR